MEMNQLKISFRNADGNFDKSILGAKIVRFRLFEFRSFDMHWDTD